MIRFLAISIFVVAPLVSLFTTPGSDVFVGILIFWSAFVFFAAPLVLVLLVQAESGFD